MAKSSYLCTAFLHLRRQGREEKTCLACPSSLPSRYNGLPQERREGQAAHSCWSYLIHCVSHSGRGEHLAFGFAVRHLRSFILHQGGAGLGKNSPLLLHALGMAGRLSLPLLGRHSCLTAWHMLTQHTDSKAEQAALNSGSRQSVRKQLLQNKMGGSPCMYGLFLPYLSHYFLPAVSSFTTTHCT